jgi:hypothetical protein
MHYEVQPIMFENTPSETFNSYAEAYKRAKELITKAEIYQCIAIWKIDNNNKEHLVEVILND